MRIAVLAQEPPKYPALTNAQPLGLALTQAVKEGRGEGDAM